MASYGKRIVQGLIAGAFALAVAECTTAPNFMGATKDSAHAAEENIKNALNTLPGQKGWRVHASSSVYGGLWLNEDWSPHYFEAVRYDVSSGAGRIYTETLRLEPSNAHPCGEEGAYKLETTSDKSMGDVWLGGHEEPNWHMDPEDKAVVQALMGIKLNVNSVDSLESNPRGGDGEIAKAVLAATGIKMRVVTNLPREHGDFLSTLFITIPKDDTIPVVYEFRRGGIQNERRWSVYPDTLTYSTDIKNGRPLIVNYASKPVTCSEAKDTDLAVTIPALGTEGTLGDHIKAIAKAAGQEISKQPPIPRGVVTQAYRWVAKRVQNLLVAPKA